MRGAATIGISLLLVPLGACAQPLPTFKATAQGSFMLPLALQNPVFNGLTSTMGQVDGAFNLPLYKGIGIGAGVNGTWYELNENALSPAVTAGTTDRLLAYGKLWWGRYTGPRTFFLVDAKLGRSTWDWQCTTCRQNERQTGFHWALDAGYFVHASDNLAFGVLLGYQEDAYNFGPGVIGLERFPGRTDMGGRYRFLTVGLGFTTGFQRSRERDW